jgi:tRNA 2-thiouridine synthesizing protein A
MHAPEPMNVKDPSADRRIDTRGLLCPYPFIEAKQALEALPPGSTVEILTDSEPTATSSIPILCERNGYTFTTARDGDLWVLVVEKP